MSTPTSTSGRPDVVRLRDRVVSARIHAYHISVEQSEAEQRFCEAVRVHRLAAAAVRSPRPYTSSLRAMRNLKRAEKRVAKEKREFEELGRMVQRAWDWAMTLEGELIRKVFEGKGVPGMEFPVRTGPKTWLEESQEEEVERRVEYGEVQLEVRGGL